MLALLLAGALGGALGGPPAPAAAATVSTLLPRQGDIARVAASVGDRQRSVAPCTASACAISSKWNDGVLMMGMVDHWRAFGTASYRTYAETWANKNSWALFSDTSRDQQNPNWHNRMAAGYTYLQLFRAGSTGATLADVTRNLNDQLALDLAPERQQLVDYIFPGKTVPSKSWKEVDANFMALPTWIMMGRQTGNAAYYNRARDLQAYQIGVMGLQDSATGLWFRDETFKTLRSPDGKDIFWGRGNGWIAGALAIALSELPATRPEYATYRTRFADLMASIRTSQRPDGFWNMNLADANHYPAPETSATALITYAMARGISLGILNRAAYEPVVAKAWNAMVATATTDDGNLGFVQAIGKEPVPPGNAGFPDEDSSTGFGVGAFLLAGAAVHDIATRPGTTPVTAFQAETLATRVSNRDTQADVSNRFADGGLSNAANLSAAGDFVQFLLPAVPRGTYNLRVKFRLDGAQAIWQLLTNGVPTGLPVDAFDVTAHYAEWDLGTFAYTAGTKRLRFVATGRNPSSLGYGIGIDSVSFYDVLTGDDLAPGATASQPGRLVVDAAVAPVPVPPALWLLAGSLGLLGLTRSRRTAFADRTLRQPAAA